MSLPVMSWKRQFCPLPSLPLSIFFIIIAVMKSHHLPQVYCGIILIVFHYPKSGLYLCLLLKYYRPIIPKKASFYSANMTLHIFFYILLRELLELKNKCLQKDLMFLEGEIKLSDKICLFSTLCLRTLCCN